MFCSCTRLSCGFPFFSDILMQLSLPACHICYCELSTFEVFFQRGVQNRDQQQKNQQVSNFIFSPVFWAIGIAAVFLSAMHFAKLRLLVDDLFRHLRILISPASSASTVSLCKWPPHVSESAQKYFSDNHNLEKHLLLSGCGLIRACFGLKRKTTLVW